MQNETTTKPVSRLLGGMSFVRAIGSAATLAAVLVLAAVHYVLLPAGRRVRTLSQLRRVRSAEYTRLAANVADGERIDRQIETLPPSVWQTGSDQRAFSEFLHLLERQTDRRRVRLVKARPGAVETRRACRVYRVTLSVVGSVPAILQYVSDLTHGQAAIGLEALSLRAQGPRNQVECTLSLCSVRLIKGKSARRGAEKRAADVAGGGDAT